jgi:hypothetical protein
METVPAPWSAGEPTGQGRNLGYLETMVRIEIEGEALARRVSQAADTELATGPQCRSIELPALALRLQPD